MLRDEIARYTELSGNDGLHTPIGIIGAYLDGYEKGRADAPQWIPVTERLPENEQDVLVTVNDGCTHVEIDYFTGAHFLNYWDEVLAWMPLPEPWKGENDVRHKEKGD